MARVVTKKSTVPGKVPLAADLEIGELAVNTADAKLFTKHSDNTIKQLGGDAASSYFRTEPIAATASGQTSFTVPGGYTPGAIFVSLNGATLPPADFTATNGTTVVLASGNGIVAGSVMLVHVLSAFEVADALPLGGTAADASRFGGQLPAYYATQEDLAGVTPGPEFYQRSNILGTVSQSGGVPTGAIIERGSNANGEYVRWADGTMECYKDSVGVGSGFTWTFPAAFSSPPAVSAIDISGIANNRYSAADAPSQSSWSLRFKGVSSQSIVTTTASVRAKGRWY